METAPGSAIDHSVAVTSSGPSPSAQVVQVETLGKTGLTVMLVMFGIIVLVGILSGYAVGVGQARHEDLEARMRIYVGKTEVVQYDVDQIRAQLIAKGIIEHTGH